MSYTIIREVCVAMTQCPALRMWFSSSEDECREAARCIEEISFGKAIGNCICVFNGYLLHMEQPRKKMVGNQRQYYSGHYCKFGVNIQAACDRIPSTTPGAEPPRYAKNSGSARSHSTHLETSSSNRP